MTSPNRQVTLVAQTTISANVTTASTPITGLAGVNYIAFESVFLYGAGGGTLAVLLQTSLDGGTTWIDIASHNYTTSAASKVSAVSTSVAASAASTPSDGSLSSNTILQGVIGDRIRAKFISASTVYSGATSIAVYAVLKGVPH